MFPRYWSELNTPSIHVRSAATQPSQRIHTSTVLVALLATLHPLLSLSASDMDLFDLSLEQLTQIPVTVASRREEPRQQVAAVVSVISAQEIASYGYRSVAEALEHVVNFVNNSDLASDNFGVRGVNGGSRANSRNLRVTIDGQRVDYRPTHGNILDESLIPISAVQQIEVLRGPASALYGANALLGVINIVTKKNQSNQTEANWQAGVTQTEQAGSGYFVDGWFSTQLGPWQTNLSISQTHDDRAGIRLPARSPNYSRSGNRPSQQDKKRSSTLFLNLSRETELATLGFDVYYRKRAVDNVFSDVQPLPQPRPSRLANEQGFARTTLEHRGNAWRWSVNSTYSFGRPANDDRIELNNSEFYLKRLQDFSALEWHGQIEYFAAEDTSLLLGVDIEDARQDREQLLRIARVDNRPLQAPTARTETTSDQAIYLQYQQPLSDTIHLSGSYRFDHDDIANHQDSFQLGLVWSLDDTQLLRFFAGTSYQRPSVELLYRQPATPGDIAGNSNLSIQTADTLEVSYSITLSPRMETSLTVYQTNITDLVRLQSDFTNLLAKNSGDQQVQGLEFSARYHSTRISTYANAFYNHSERDNVNGNLLPLTNTGTAEIFPQAGFNLGLSMKLDDAFNFALNSNWLNRRPASIQNINIAQQRYSLQAGWTTAANISYQIPGSGPSSRVRLKVDDLFNQQRVIPGFGGIDFPSLGRRWALSYTRSF